MISSFLHMRAYELFHSVGYIFNPFCTTFNHSHNNCASQLHFLITDFFVIVCISHVGDDCCMSHITCLKSSLLYLFCFRFILKRPVTQVFVILKKSTYNYLLQNMLYSLIWLKTNFFIMTKVITFSLTLDLIPFYVS